MALPSLPPAVALKLDLMFDGIRYTDALRRAAEHAFPNYFPHRFAPGEADPTGTGRADIPYMVVTPDGMHCRIQTSARSPWSIAGSRADGWTLRHDDGRPALPVGFEPAQPWLARETTDGVPGYQAGVTLHGDMVVVNLAPGCEYFLAPKQDGVAMRCTFCTYGSPDVRLRHLNQVMGRTAIPDETYRRMQEVLARVLRETAVATIYLVGGSLTDPGEEGVRFVELARRVRVVSGRVPVTCGSGALLDESLRILHDERLVDAVCFNLEVWSEPLFARVCPGKQRYVGYARWIASLERAVALWGRERVYSAMVAGVELGDDVGLSPTEARDLALRGAEDLCGRGIMPIYSPYWPPSHHERPERMRGLRTFFEELQLGYHAIRRRHRLHFWDGFVTRRSSYMQLERDVDHGLAGEADG